MSLLTTVIAVLLISSQTCYGLWRRPAMMGNGGFGQMGGGMSNFGGLGQMGSGMGSFGGLGKMGSGMGSFGGLGKMGSGMGSSGGLGQKSNGVSYSGGSAGNTGCSAYEIISARGTGESQTNPNGSAGFIKYVLAGYPGGTSYEVVYPASMDYTNGPKQGASDINSHISAKSQACPNQRYVFFGYSEGAMVVTQYLNTYKISPSQVAAIALYGNPFHVSGAPQNTCSGTSGNGIGGLYGVRMPSQYASVTYDCCKQGDMICQTSGSMMAHLSYAGSQEEKNAASFAISKLRLR